jgi:hypothetical protein
VAALTTGIDEGVYSQNKPNSVVEMQFVIVKGLKAIEESSFPQNASCRPTARCRKNVQIRA